ncbi:hypothetical protein SLS62_002322 [Diatrype stigma]|uniref:Kinesin motor domain-containing protein n=1 Tax=Diatrype stigma TaxID=117547 RepID=A0AAN9UXJ9_9PEZI
MATSPPSSPAASMPPRPMSAMIKPSTRSSSRMSTHSKAGGSRASDEDARTAVRVAVRVRPPLKPSDPGYDLIPQRFQRSMGKKLFVFDRVFGEDVDQEGVWDYLSDSINAFLQGYNVSLLAYGQSGAGKSYTMGTSGPLDQIHPEAMGVIPRAAKELFDKLDAPVRSSNRNSMSQLRTPQRYSTQSLPKADKNWQLKATYVEIYNEQLRDLLVPDHQPQFERAPVTIREDQKGNILLTGLQQIDINSVDDLMSALNFGSTIRQTDATAINAKSSRSHAVFSLNLIQRKPKGQSGHGAERSDKRLSMPIEAMTGSETWVTTDSKLHFVDLAGSERLKNTGAQGERAREGISINAGLAALGKVISQLSSRQAGSHVSYRDSRLTRLLQDSLGGNAITYMIACVTPAEFHISETLNTVQYAQRARAIQSKPRIQQVEEGNKQQVIDRLKAEVAFLREQIRSAERSGDERRNAVPSDRGDRQNEREVELQSLLVDVQENYKTLSQRHAKLISEMAKARDEEATGNREVEGYQGDVATERLNRSNSFAEAVEQVVLEYEKTIQSLEQSLSSTRATLSNTETNLFEKETRCAYVETLNAHLNAKLHKLMDREANTESYLSDLEAKLDGHTSGEEKNSIIVSELRKEIARLRELESSNEDYIENLEQRLAEADQDAELMQQEMDRLEHLIKRQRSLGQLDTLLNELDGVDPVKQSEGEHGPVNGIGSHRRNFSERSARSHSSRPSLGLREVLPEVKEGAEEDNVSEIHGEESFAGDDASEIRATVLEKPAEMEPPPSPAQSQYVADKLENVTQELVDLKVEHENTLTEFDLLHHKYEEALQSLAELQDRVDEARHPRPERQSIISVTSPTDARPPSFLSDGQLSDVKDGTHLSSQSLSSELSSAMESPATIGTPRTETPKPSEPRDTPMEENTRNEALIAELERLKGLASGKEAAEKELAERYAELEEKHQETLDIVEELKTEVMKAKWHEPASPRTTGPVIRRKSSQNVMIIDRAHRSFASLRNIAAENFENEPDVMQNFEINLNAAMHELHARSERIQELEADIAAAKKEMETKMTIITGLTRERSSMKSSPMDISMVGTMRDQLEQKEKQLQEMQEAHVTRENELKAEIESLRAAFREKAENQSVSQEATRDSNATYEKQISDLQSELSGWESKHQQALEAMRSTEQQMRQTISQLESELVSINAKFSETQANAKDETEAREAEDKRQSLVTSLQNEIDEYKAIIDSNALKVAELEQSHAAAKQQLEEASEARDLALNDSANQKEIIGRLESQIAEYEKALLAHEQSLDQLRDSHAQELEELRSRSKEEYESHIDTLMAEQAENIRLLETDLNDARDDLIKVANQVAFALGCEVSVDKLSEHIEYLVANQRALDEEQKRSGELEGHVDELSVINNTLMRDLETVKSSLNEVLLGDIEPTKKSPYPTVREQLAAIKKKTKDLENKNKKNSRLVEELEDQLQTNFDQAQATTNRLSLLQSERNHKLEDAMATRYKLQAELDATREQMAALQVRQRPFESRMTFTDVKQARVEEAEGLKRNGSLSQVRKTGSVTSLPSPPPAIPLPPLPAGSSPTTGVPPTPTGTRPGSNDLAFSHIQDQEARIGTIDKALKAERQLTSTLEEALTDLERQSNKVKADCDAWRKRALELETEVKELKEKPQQDNRWRDSLQQIEEERKKREAAERAHTHLEERMKAINSKKKKKGSLNCF